MTDDPTVHVAAGSEPTPPAVAAIEAATGRKVDGRIPGGCRRCPAWQAVAKVGQILALIVVHTDNCPTWLRLVAGEPIDGAES